MNKIVFIITDKLINKMKMKIIEKKFGWRLLIVFSSVIVELLAVVVVAAAVVSKKASDFILFRVTNVRVFLK